MLSNNIEQTKTGYQRVFSADEPNRLGTATGGETHTANKLRADILWSMPGGYPLEYALGGRGGVQLEYRWSVNPTITECRVVSTRLSPSVGWPEPDPHRVPGGLNPTITECWVVSRVVKLEYRG